MTDEPLIEALRMLRDQMGKQKWDWDSIEGVLGMSLLMLGVPVDESLAALRAEAYSEPVKAQLRGHFAAVRAVRASR